MEFKNAKDGGLFEAPRPLLPLIRRAPKKLSSTSTSPEKGDWVSKNSAMRYRIARR